MMCLKYEPGTARLKVQTHTLSSDGPEMKMYTLYSKAPILIVLLFHQSTAQCVKRGNHSCPFYYDKLVRSFDHSLSSLYEARNMKSISPVCQCH